jgi:hypothetical protein
MVCGILEFNWPSLFIHLAYDSLPHAYSVLSCAKSDFSRSLWNVNIAQVGHCLDGFYALVFITETVCLLCGTNKIFNNNSGNFGLCKGQSIGQRRLVLDLDLGDH